MPPVTMGSSVEDFFDNLLNETKAGTTLPNWYALSVLAYFAVKLNYYWTLIGAVNCTLR